MQAIGLNVDAGIQRQVGTQVINDLQISDQAATTVCIAHGEAGQADATGNGGIQGNHIALRFVTQLDIQSGCAQSHGTKVQNTRYSTATSPGATSNASSTNSTTGIRNTHRPQSNSQAGWQAHTDVQGRRSTTIGIDININAISGVSASDAKTADYQGTRVLSSNTIPGETILIVNFQ